jgi:prepilin-type processing-associated H-X9-DG protein
MVNSGKRKFIEGRFINVVAALLVAFMVADGFFSIKANGVEKSKQIICLSNMKQLGLGMLQYSQDYDGNLPQGIRPSSDAATAGVGWAIQLWPYIKSEHDFACPDDSSETGLKGLPKVSYALNSNAALYPKLKEMVNPSKTILLFEVSNSRSPVDFYPNPEQIARFPLSAVGDGTQSTLTDGQPGNHLRLATGKIGGRAFTRSCSPRHREGSDYLMADGHVKWLLPTWVSSGSNAATSSLDQSGAVIGQAAGTACTEYETTFSTK